MNDSPVLGTVVVAVVAVPFTNGTPKSVALLGAKHVVLGNIVKSTLPVGVVVDVLEADVTVT
jgi:hypothetical protein